MISVFRTLVATCEDNLRNQGENGVDCGGPCTAKCPGESCTAATQCQSGVCGTDNTCRSEYMFEEGH